MKKKKGIRLKKNEETLSSLFEYLSLEYQEIEPHWKKFSKGVHSIERVEKKRLDNAIWRAWHMHYKLSKPTPFIHFETRTLDAYLKDMPRSVVLEGAYWKRSSVHSVIQQYMKFRKWYFLSRAYLKGRFEPPSSVPTSSASAPHSLTSHAGFPLGIESSSLRGVEEMKSLSASSMESPSLCSDFYSPFSVNMSLMEDYGLSGDSDFPSVFMADSIQHPSLENLLYPTIPLHMFPTHATESDLLLFPQNYLFPSQNLTTNPPIPGSFSPPFVPENTSSLSLFVDPKTSLTASSLGSSSFVSSSDFTIFHGDQLSGHKRARKGSVSQEEMGESGKKASHLVAEQKRRYNIKCGFEELQNIIPGCKNKISQQKFSKATVLQKSIEYIDTMTRIKLSMEAEAEYLQQEITILNSNIQNLQTSIEAQNFSNQGSIGTAQKMYHDYVGKYSSQNIKFWVFSTIIDKLFLSFNEYVNTTSFESLSASVFAWIERACQPPALQETVMASLKTLCSRLFVNPAADPC